MTLNTDRQSVLARASAFGALVALAWTLYLVAGGGGNIRLGPILLSSRNPIRPIIITAVLYLISLWLGRRSASRPWESLRDRLDQVSPAVVIVAAAAVFWTGVTYGAHAAGGADTFGYVSQAYLWLKGDLHIEQPFAAQVPWPDADSSLTPLGYRPGTAPHTIVPVYSPGLPLIMAGAHALSGVCGPYYVTPLFGALLVALTFALAYRLSGSRLTGSLAAVFMACSPAFTFNFVVPWSDTPTTALWTGALLLLTWPRIAPAAVAGVVAALAILVRPNLVPLTAAGLLAAALWGGPAGRAPRGMRALAFLAPIVPVAAGIGLLNYRLYGSPLESGYGPTSDLYAVANFTSNVQLYSTWLIESHGVFVLLALLPIAIGPARPAWLTFRAAAPLALFAAILILSYLFYIQFDAWWYLRFLLPGFPLLFICLAAAIVWLTRVLPAPVAVPGLLLAVMFIAAQWVGFVRAQFITEVGYGEQRYVAVAQYVDRELPPTAVLLAMQHSGTLRFYAGRMTIRYDFIDREWLRQTIEWLDAHGYPPFIVLEDWEEERFRERFEEQGPLGRLEIPIIARTTQHIPIRIYDPLGTLDGAPTPEQIHIARTHQCLAPRGDWAR